MFRWLQELSSYQFDVIHMPGKEMPADPLSRSDHLRDPTPEETDEIRYIGAGTVSTDLNDITLDRARIKAAQEEDVVLPKILQ